MKDLFQRTKKICRDHDIKPARSRGQSFLIKEQVYNHIINAADITEKDRVLEVGPGLGFLTEKLAEKAGKVASVEVDETIYSLLQERLAKYPHLALIYKDILKVEPENIFFSKEQGAGLDYKIVANLPYNITSIFLRRFLAEVKRPTVMVLMLQKEVADRILRKSSAKSQSSR